MGNGFMFGDRVRVVNMTDTGLDFCADEYIGRVGTVTQPPTMRFANDPRLVFVTLDGDDNPYALTAQNIEAL